MKRQPSRAPQNVSTTVWYYESKGSLLFVVESRSGLGTYERTIQFRVPASKLRRSLARMPKPKKAGK